MSPRPPASSPELKGIWSKTPAEKSHRLLIVSIDENGIALVNSQVVQLPLPLQRKKRVKGLKVELLAENGDSIYTTWVEDPRPIRGEFESDSTIEGHHIQQSTAALTLRLPVTEVQTRIVISDEEELGILVLPGTAR